MLLQVAVVSDLRINTCSTVHVILFHTLVVVLCPRPIIHIIIFYYYICSAVLVAPMFRRDLSRTIFHHIHTLIFYVTVSVYTASFSQFSPHVFTLNMLLVLRARRFFKGGDIVAKIALCSVICSVLFLWRAFGLGRLGVNCYRPYT